MTGTIALLMIAAHMMGGYVTQNNWMAANKFTDWRVRTAHVLVYTLGFVSVPIAAGMTAWTGLAFLVAVFVPHWITDCRRWASAEPWPPKPIMVDQSIHACCLAGACWAFFGG